MPCMRNAVPRSSDKNNAALSGLIFFVLIWQVIY
jgi:hypothetical protein